MIRVLVVDDDYHVAQVHSRGVSRVAGFEVVGEAHSADQAAAMIETTAPDLLLLDMYLPDRSGLDLVRSLSRPERGDLAGPAPLPDFILVTAARDVDSVRAAIQLGAIYYLVKPFAFAALREQLEAYREWRGQLCRTSEADQDTVETLYSMLRAPATAARSRRQLAPSMSRVLDLVGAAGEPIGAAEVAEQLGMSRSSAQRYLAGLLRRGVLDLDLAYGSTGRPEHKYFVRAARC